MVVTSGGISSGRLANAKKIIGCPNESREHPRLSPLQWPTYGTIGHRVYLGFLPLHFIPFHCTIGSAMAESSAP